MELSKKTNMYMVLAMLALMCAPLLVAGCVTDTVHWYVMAPCAVWTVVALFVGLLVIAHTDEVLGYWKGMYDKTAYRVIVLAGELAEADLQYQTDINQIKNLQAIRDTDNDTINGLNAELERVCKQAAMQHADLRAQLEEAERVLFMVADVTGNVRFRQTINMLDHYVKHGRRSDVDN